VTDFYFLADTFDQDNGTTYSDRLGDIEVRDMDVSNFLLSQFWTPYSGENPKDTINRLKVGTNVPVPGVLGDTNAERATILPLPPSYELGEEIIYSEFYLWGAPEDVSGVLEMDVTPIVGSELQPDVKITLPATTVFEPATHYQVFRAEANPTGDSLESTVLNRLQFKVGFSEPTTET